MSIFDIILIGFSLAMDAFAVALCKGLSIKKINIKSCLTVGLYFGIFQSLMPLLGFILATNFQHFIIKIDHWVVFLLLIFIGFKMIIDVFLKEDNIDDKINFKTMIGLSIATSLDAFAIGITLSFLNVNLIISIIVIGFITFILSTFGVLIGNKVGSMLGIKSQLIGGLILITIGLKILFEHLNLI